MTRGVTLVELIVALAVLGVVVGVTGLAVHHLAGDPGDAVVRALHAAQAEAARSGEPVVLRLGGRTVRLFPDGSAVGGPLAVGGVTYRIEALTSEVIRAAR